MTRRAGAEAETVVRSPPARHVPALDGIRALSVAAVLCFHGGVSWACGGFLGVDAFFVLSGYLITTLLVRERDRRGGIDLVAFWGRRARRLLPALLLVVTVVVVLAPRILPPVEVRLLRGDGLAALFDVANWRMIVRGEGYFEQTAAPSPLQHTWSLGIEEQFYLVWPLLLVGLLRGRRPLRRLLVACAAGAVASAIWLGLLHDPMDPARAYFGTDTRAASLLVGAALAAALADGRISGAPLGTGVRRIASALAVAGLLFTGWAWTELSGDDIRLYRGGLLLAALAVAAVIAHVVVAPDGLSARVLSIPPLPALGRISYGVYLWHWPVFIAVNADRTGLQGTSLFGLRCLVTVVVATLSYVLLERPIRSSRMAASRSLNGGLVLGAVAVTVATVLVTTSVPQRASDVARQPATDGTDGTDGIDGIDQVAPRPGQAPASRAAPTRHRLRRRPRRDTAVPGNRSSSTSSATLSRGAW